MSGMKINRRTKGLHWLVMFVVSCFLFTTDVSAQAYPDLVTETQAETLLFAEVPNLEALMNQLPPNSVGYQIAEKKYLMYNHTWENLTQGMILETALTATYGEFGTDAAGNDLNSDELPSITPNGPNYGDAVFDGLVTFLEQ